jgi:hypothetical protein
MIRRETDAAVINRIVNHPDVLPHFDLARRGRLDFGPCIDQPDSYVVLTDGEACGALFEWSAPEVWQCHTMFLPEVRGSQAIAAAKQMAAYMLREHAVMLWGETPSIHRAALCFNRRVGFQCAGIGFHDVLGEVQRFVLRKQDGLSSRSGSHGGS